MNRDPALLAKLSEQLPFLDLFEQLRSAGMQLTMEHYDLLQRSLWRGHGSGSWADLQRVCGILWVKPSANYDRTLFDREFEQYRRQCQDEVPKQVLPEKVVPVEKEQSDRPVLPEVPPRLMPERQKSSPIKAPIGIQGNVLDVLPSMENFAGIEETIIE
jgi:uncharacterized protein